jgi:hypothetical protein
MVRTQLEVTIEYGYYSLLTKKEARDKGYIISDDVKFLSNDVLGILYPEKEFLGQEIRLTFRPVVLHHSCTMFDEEVQEHNDEKDQTNNSDSNTDCCRECMLKADCDQVCGSEDEIDCEPPTCIMGKCSKFKDRNASECKQFGYPNDNNPNCVVGAVNRDHFCKNCRAVYSQRKAKREHEEVKGIDEITYGELISKFKERNKDFANLVEDYRPAVGLYKMQIWFKCGKTMYITYNKHEDKFYIEEVDE